MNRRHYLSGIATTGLAATAGCSALPGVNISMSVPESSVYFDSIEYEYNQSLLYGTEEDMIIRLNEDPPENPTTVILFIDGEQYGYERVGTGMDVVRVTGFDFPKPAHISNTDSIEIAAVSGGTEDERLWVGGDILERVELSVDIEKD